MSARNRNRYGRWFFQKLPFWGVVISLALMGASASALWHYQHHLYWKFKVSPHVGQVDPVPVSPMPVADLGHDWRRYRIGPLSLSLPPRFFEGNDRQATTEGIELSSGGWLVDIQMPRSLREYASRFQEVNLALGDSRSAKSLVEFEIDAYRATSDAFRWSMSPEEARKFGLWMRIVPEFAPRNCKLVETLSNGRLDGLMRVLDDRNVKFHWCSTSQVVGGAVKFTRSEGPLDLAFVREVCQSLEFDGSDPPRRTKEQMQRLLDALNNELDALNQESTKGAEE